MPTNELVVGEERFLRVPLKESGEIHITVTPVDFGLEKRKEEKKSPVVVEFDDDLNRQFDVLLVCADFLQFYTAYDLFFKRMKWE